MFYFVQHHAEYVRIFCSRPCCALEEHDRGQRCCGFLHCECSAGFSVASLSLMALSERPVFTCRPAIGSWPRVLLNLGVLGC